ncbi:hypothetical protein B0H37_005431 [Clostridium beijerinckii]|jgi:hypothetical protein|nr:hypothetical protein [Clostridium beijerinckii]NOV73314.1 hypothetical protein [Clostridium beijerinckii]NOW35377.1 hypothetical protein [Clostridium beijerinckii]
MVIKNKDVIKEIVAKPLNDNQKRKLVTIFITNSVN